MRKSLLVKSHFKHYVATRVLQEAREFLAGVRPAIRRSRMPDRRLWFGPRDLLCMHAQE